MAKDLFKTVDQLINVMNKRIVIDNSPKRAKFTQQCTSPVFLDSGYQKINTTKLIEKFLEENE